MAINRLLLSSILLLVWGTSALSEEQAVPGEETEAATVPPAGEPLEFELNNPNSIEERYRLDREPKEYLFQLPGAEKVLLPWSDLRAHLDERYGFKPGLSFTHLYQSAGGTIGPESDASGFEIVVDGTWDVLGRGTESPTSLGFEFLYRDRLGTEIPPVALFGQVGSLYPTSVAFAEVGPTLGQLWIQQKFGNRFGFRVGKFFPVAAYDFFPLKNFRTDFVDGIHAANLVIPLPDRGLGAFAMYRPQPRTYLRFGVHDANADAERAGFDSLFNVGELFTILEAGLDPGFKRQVPGKPPFGDVHVTAWHQDQRDGAIVDEAWGVAVSGSQRFGRLLPFLRYGYSDGGSGGPSPMEHMINAGVAVDDIFGQANDRIGVGFTWADPADPSLGNQSALDIYYRIQVTPEFAVSPMLQVIFDPVRNPSEDEVLVFGIRSRIAF